MLLILRLFLYAGPVAAATDDPTVRYDRSSDRLSVEAQDVSLQELLSSVAAATGIEVRMTAGADTTVSVVLHDASLEKGLRKMAQDLDLSQAVLYAEGGQGEGRARVSRWIVVPRGQGVEEGTGREAFSVTGPAPGGSLAGNEAPSRSPALENATRIWRLRTDGSSQSATAELQRRHNEERQTRVAEKECRRAKRENRKEERANRRQGGNTDRAAAGAIEEEGLSFRRNK
jgi:hypothetical protein